MDFHDKNNSNNEMWEWEDEEYLRSESGIDVPNCLWDNINQDEQSLFYMLEEQTPIKDCADFAYDASNLADKTNKGLEECQESSQLKRRRMLQFTTDAKDKSTGNERISSAFLKSKVREETVIRGGCQGNVTAQWNTKWNTGYSEPTIDDRCLMSNDVLNEPSEGWLVNCFNDSEMHCSSNEMNNHLPCNEQMDISGFYNIPIEMETNVAQQTSSSAHCRIFRGRKSFINAPTKLTTSVAYPFALIKPCGVQGDVTLNDINEKIHAPPPSRSKQKTDDEASGSYPTSAFSGKPVVGKTKIRTEGGKGSITITRTKG